MQPLLVRFPQWECCIYNNVARGCFHGCQSLRQLLQKIQQNDPGMQFDETTLGVARADQLDMVTKSTDRIQGLPFVLNNARMAAEILKERRPSKLYILGGGCGIEPTPVGYLNGMVHGKLGVIWCDAHADLNTPHTSPSGKYHGMPLRHICGEGNKEIHKIVESCGGKPVSPSQIALIGTREFDKAEAEFVSENSVYHATVDEVSSSPEKAAQRLADHFKAAGVTDLYIHFDLDCTLLADVAAVRVPTEAGVPSGKMCEFIHDIARLLPVAGVSVVELSHEVDEPLDSTTTSNVKQILSAQWKALTVNM
eukprot:Clim_evm24s55 gene=Clim_evmTU24s55